MTGCQEARNAISIVEVTCPRCRESVEVFVRDGSLYTDAVCEVCGYRMEALTGLEEIKCG